MSCPSLIHFLFNSDLFPIHLLFILSFSFGGFFGPLLLFFFLFYFFLLLLLGLGWLLMLSRSFRPLSNNPSLYRLVGILLALTICGLWIWSNSRLQLVHYSCTLFRGSTSRLSRCFGFTFGFSQPILLLLQQLLQLQLSRLRGFDSGSGRLGGFSTNNRCRSYWLLTSKVRSFFFSACSVPITTVFRYHAKQLSQNLCATEHTFSLSQKGVHRVRIGLYMIIVIQFFTLKNFRKNKFNHIQTTT